MSELSLKILVGYHKPAYLIKSDVYVPIHLGRALATQISKDGQMSEEDYQWMLDNMIGDDTGDNISHLNREFCELTALYWAWKNYDKLGNPDYIGFCHYRRFLDFSTELNDPKIKDSIIYEKALSEDLIPFKNKQEANKIKSEISQFDIIHGCLINHNLTVEQQWSGLSRPEFDLPSYVFCEVLDFASSKFKDYSLAIERYKQAKKHYWYNCFIMKKEYFMEYCNFLFSVLLEFYKTLDYSQFSIKASRVLAYMSERLLGVFITYQELKQKVIGYRPIVYIEDTSIQQNLFPAFSKNNIAMFCSTDDNYAPYCGVLLKSIIEHADANNNYDLIVLEDKLSEENKVKIKALQNGHPNISIRFYNVANLMVGKKFYLCAHFTIATYYRMFAPSIFKNYDKIVYLDIDMIVLNDIAELYNINITKLWLGACLDFGVMAKLKSQKYETFDYFKKSIGVNDVFNEYFQAGMIVFNLKELRNNGVEQKLIDTALSNKFAYVDQDVLNKVCHNQVYFIDSLWNTVTNEGRKKGLMELLPIRHYLKWQEDKKNPKIIHYCSFEKPWKNPDSDMASYWWHYARMTPFYEEILYKNINQSQPQSQPNITREMLGNIFNYTKIKHKYWKYKILSKITFGKKRKKYKQKRKDLKARLKAVKRFLKGKYL